MRFLICCVSFVLLAGTGCFHRKAAAPQERFSDVPGLPKTPEPAPVEVKQKPKPQKKVAKAEVSPESAGAAKSKKQGATRTGQGATRTGQNTQAPVPSAVESKSPKLIVTPENGLVGKVEMANQNARYVVLSFPIGHLPALEQRLSVYRNGLKVGEVKVSGPQIEDNVVADIVEGESSTGDEVREK